MPMYNPEKCTLAIGSRVVDWGYETPEDPTKAVRITIPLENSVNRQVYEGARRLTTQVMEIRIARNRLFGWLWKHFPREGIAWLLTVKLVGDIRVYGAIRRGNEEADLNAEVLRWVKLPYSLRIRWWFRRYREARRFREAFLARIPRSK